jgi:hypothetical protein
MIDRHSCPRNQGLRGVGEEFFPSFRAALAAHGGRARRARRVFTFGAQP